MIFRLTVKRTKQIIDWLMAGAYPKKPEYIVSSWNRIPKDYQDNLINLANSFRSFPYVNEAARPEIEAVLTKLINKSLDPNRKQ